MLGIPKTAPMFKKKPVLTTVFLSIIIEDKTLLYIVTFWIIRKNNFQVQNNDKILTCP